jgi:hypothetical protein
MTGNPAAAGLEDRGHQVVAPVVVVRVRVGNLQHADAGTRADDVSRSSVVLARDIVAVAPPCWHDVSSP